MKLYRGTPEPESRPIHREFPCVYFTPDKDYAAEYAAGDEAETEQGWVQQYDVGRQRLLTNWTAEAWALADEYYGHKVTDSVMVDLFWGPEAEWVELLASRGYTGTTNGRDVCILDPSAARIISRWFIEQLDDGFSWHKEEVVRNRG